MEKEGAAAVGRRAAIFIGARVRRTWTVRQMPSMSRTKCTLQKADMARRIEVYEVETGRSLGEIGEARLRRLFDLLEEESEADRDYWIDEATLELLAERGADAGLVTRLRDALGGRDGFDVAWREVG